MLIITFLLKFRFKEKDSGKNEYNYIAEHLSMDIIPIRAIMSYVFISVKVISSIFFISVKYGIVYFTFLELLHYNH